MTQPEQPPWGKVILAARELVASYESGDWIVPNDVEKESYKSFWPLFNELIIRLDAYEKFIKERSLK